MRIKLKIEDLEIIGIMSAFVSIFGMVVFESLIPLLLLFVWFVCCIKILTK